LEAIAARFERDNRAVRRLFRHVPAGTVGVGGKHLRQHMTRVEFWTYNPDSGNVERVSKQTVKVWGWRPSEVQRLLVRALEQDRVRKIKELKRKRGAGPRVMEGDDGDVTLGGASGVPEGDRDTSGG
jgi:hypothetical protein